jgi:hypothetical protein
MTATSHAQDPPKPASKFKVDLKLKIEGAAPAWSFVAEGTTDYPDGVLLKTRLFAVEEVVDFKGGKRIDEESLIQKGSGWVLIPVKGGKFRHTLLTSARKPYSIWYRTRATYDPNVQEVAIADKLDENEASWTTDLHHGTPADFDREVASTLKDLTREMEDVQSLYRDLRGRFQVWNRAPDAAAFAEWRKGFSVKVDAIRKNNDTRYSIWIVWLERQAKFRFESFCDRFDMLCVDFDEWLGLKKKGAELSKDAAKHAEGSGVADRQDRQLRIMYGLTAFMAYFEEAREALGIDTPSDPDLVGAILKDYEAATGELAGLAAKGDAAAWKEKAPEARARARRALMKLSAPGLLPRRAYDRVLELADKFAQLYVLLERTASGSKPPANETAAEHAGLVADFRKYAGVK